MKSLNCCIVCYNTVNSSLSATLDKNEECVTGTFVRLFQRHVNNFSLESSQVKVSQSTLTFQPNNDTGSQSVKLSACASCRNMLFSFNYSYGDLKCAEMKANWSLEQLANVIRFADYAPAKLNMLVEGVKNVNEDEDNQLINNLVDVISTFRKQLESQCRLQSKNQFPRVSVMKSSLVDNSTENVRKDKGRFPLPTESTTHLIITALKNLSSLQLVLYLALFDSVSTDKTNTNISHTNFQANDSFFEQHEKKVSSRSLRDMVSTDYKKSVDYSPPSPSLPPSPISIADVGHGMKNEWDSGDGVECFEIDSQEEEIKPVLIKRIQNVPAHCCSSCHFQFGSNKELEQHFATCSKTSHGSADTTIPLDIKREPIEITNNEENIQWNTTRIDESTKRYSCDQCGQRYKSAATLRWHKLIHLITAAKKFTCRYCGYKFISKTLLETHVQVHTRENPFIINLQVSKCETGRRNRPRSSKTRIRKYVIVGNKKVPSKYTCIFCQKVFKFRREYIQHLYAEIKESAYWCSLCSRGFSQRSNRNGHMKNQLCQKKKQTTLKQK